MRITSVHLKNFKRFTDLLVRDIPDSAKLVVVVGPNGCGKSSLFDAFLAWYRSKAEFGGNGDEPYFRKRVDVPYVWDQNVQITLKAGDVAKRGSFYVRSAYRNDPDFSVTGFNRPDTASDVLRVQRLIENDQAVADNYRRLVYDTVSGVYDVANDSKSVQQLREELIGQLRTSMQKVFGDLLLNSISDPLGAGTFFFEKGTTKAYHYKNLSGGEKAAFDLLLDLHIKKKFFPDAVYCIDEVETHLHTRVQGALVRELADILPGTSQLWITTHSLGVLRAAQEMEAATPGSVCLLDFDGIDPDAVTELAPTTLGRVSWEKMLSVALDDLSRRIAPRVVVFCEGSAIGGRRKDFDADVYNRILGVQTPDVLFVSGGSSQQVAATGGSVRDALGQTLPITRFVALADRDDRSDAEVAEFEKSGNLVLGKRNIESYLLADDVIAALAAREDKMELLAEAIKIRDGAVAASVGRGKPADDLKSAAGDTYVGLKKLLGLQQHGNTADAFMRDALAPLIVPGMPTYDALKASILDRIK